MFIKVNITEHKAIRVTNFISKHLFKLLRKFLIMLLSIKLVESFLHLIPFFLSLIDKLSIWHLGQIRNDLNIDCSINLSFVVGRQINNRKFFARK
jgi:hypothetical protein